MDSGAWREKDISDHNTWIQVILQQKKNKIMC